MILNTIFQLMSKNLFFYNAEVRGSRNLRVHKHHSSHKHQSHKRHPVEGQSDEEPSRESQHSWRQDDDKRHSVEESTEERYSDERHTDKRHTNKRHSRKRPFQRHFHIRGSVKDWIESCSDYPVWVANRFRHFWTTRIEHKVTIPVFQCNTHM